jgi:hypothetical protein
MTDHQRRGGSQAAAEADLQADISLAFHPVFVTCNLGGIALIFAGLCRGIVRTLRRWKAAVASGGLSRESLLHLGLKRIGVANIAVLCMAAAAAVLVHYYGLSPAYGATLAVIGLAVFLTDRLIEH